MENIFKNQIERKLRFDFILENVIFSDIVNMNNIVSNFLNIWHRSVEETKFLFKEGKAQRKRTEKLNTKI